MVIFVIARAILLFTILLDIKQIIKNFKDHIILQFRYPIVS